MTTINFKVNAKFSKDKATGSWLLHSRKYDILSYGKTKAKAKEMFNYMIHEILKYTK